MSSESFQTYRHSGKFAVQGPVLTLAAAVAAAVPLGYAYAYLMKWIPFIYLNVLITGGYGFLFGLLAAVVAKFGKVRNTGLAVILGLLAGAIALYFAWNGHVHSLIRDERPWLFMPAEVVNVMQILYEQGSWGMRSGGNVTGIPLAIVWIVEAGIIIGLSVFVPFGMIADTPFCEKSQCWLDQEKKIDTLDVFTDSAQLAAFQAGDLAPLAQAKPRVPGTPAFARLTLKHSPRCEEFCAVSLANVTVATDKEGNAKETTMELARNLVVPKSMLDLISRFENFKASAPAGTSEPAAGA